ncbi:hypothetical protein C3Y89_24320 [Rhizobium sp. UPM1132]|uniref:hypothetical protein n=1 Tax=Rhizobium ruizarguesonis TaxID=2081791 RepID=UPI0014458403|nr:hypothetical protein [Rhizobium ruizarguesonis]NKQ73431.1 hypothetical protein [Rhizobium ruizarguesonis]
MQKVRKADSYLGTRRWRERKSPRGDDKPAGLFSKIKDVAGFGFSVIAVTISVFTFYFGTIRQVDEVRVIVNSFPEATLDSHNVIHVFADADFILVNGGTRDAAILEIGYQIKPLEEAPYREFGCESDIFQSAKLEAFSEKPFILKKSEMRPIHISSFVDDKTEKLFKEAFASHKNDYVALCMYFRVATPSRKDFRTFAYVSLAGVLVGSESRQQEDGGDYWVTSNQTHILVHNSESIFAAFGRSE